MYHLAIDIGASSGRHIIGQKQGGRIVETEVYRFKNGLCDRNGTLCWDLDRLFREIISGMKECKSRGLVPSTVSIDMWGVDFVLLSESGEILGNAVGYRDKRTADIPEMVYKTVSKRKLFDITGIRSNCINTIYQLIAIKEKTPEQLESAADFLMLPDYFVYLLTGNKFNEYTNASTTGLIDLKTNDWAYDLIDTLGIKKSIFRPVSMPGTFAGTFKKEIAEQVGFDCNVVLAASHDTASAVMAVPSVAKNIMYISSGTWSLMGIESLTPMQDDCFMNDGFTNEGGIDHRYRVLKNIMGLWMIQNVKAELGDKYSFAELCSQAAENSDFPSTIDALDNRYLSPASMIDEIKAGCKDSCLPVPSTPGEISAVVYNSLAKCYAESADQLEKYTGNRYDTINIIGGGSNAVYLNEITARISGRKVLAGPAEATAIGNLINQMIFSGEFDSLNEARSAVKASYDIKQYN